VDGEAVADAHVARADGLRERRRVARQDLLVAGEREPEPAECLAEVGRAPDAAEI
jgi:hypothetical protein